MAAPPPQFMFDFGSPNAYLAHKVIPDIEKRTGMRFDYKPVLLGGVFKATGNRSPAEAYASIPAKLAYENLEMRRFIIRHGLVRFKSNPHFPVNTLGIMRGAVAAKRLDLFVPYVEAVFAAMWEHEAKMDDPKVIVEHLQTAGLPTEKLMTLTQDPSVKDELIANTNEAVAKGVFGSPSFLVGEELFFGKDRLAEVEAAILAKR